MIKAWRTCLTNDRLCDIRVVRRVATCCESRAATYLAMVTIAMILEWLSLCKQALVPGLPVEIARGRRDRTLR